MKRGEFQQKIFGEHRCSRCGGLFDCATLIIEDGALTGNMFTERGITPSALAAGQILCDGCLHEREERER